MVLAILPPIMAAGWRGYRWLYPPFIPLPPALNYSEAERRELLQFLSEIPRAEAFFDPGGPPDAMHISSSPAQNTPNP